MATTLTRIPHPLSELELKFGLPDAAFAALRQALQQRGARRLRLQALYFDTADGLLASERMALRLRREGGRWVQTLKAPGEGAVHREEHEVTLPGRSAAVPALDPQRHADSPAGRRLAALLQAHPSAMLEVRHATDIVRLLCLVQAGDTLVEVALDSGSASAGERSVAIHELELEHKGGPVQGLFDLADLWLRHGGLWLCTINKAQRGQRLGAPAGPPPATHADRVQLPPDCDGAMLLRAMLQSALEQVLANASEVAEGQTTDELIHQLRVGLRRLRTVLRELGFLSPRIQSDWHSSLATTFGALGQQRDHQVVSAAVRPLLEAAQAPLLQWHAGPAQPPQQRVRDSEFQAALLAVLALAHAGDDSFAPLPSAGVRHKLAARLEQLHRQISRSARRFEKLPVAEQHRVRKRLKRLRYLADFTASLWPQAALRRCMKRLARAQEALGAHNDVAVAAQAFRAEATSRPEAWFAAGWLQAHGAVTARAARKALVGVAAARRFWLG